MLLNRYKYPIKWVHVHPPPFKVRNLELREVTALIQGHTAHEKWSGDLNPRPCAHNHYTILLHYLCIVLPGARRGKACGRAFLGLGYSLARGRGKWTEAIHGAAIPCLPLFPGTVSSSQTPTLHGSVPSLSPAVLSPSPQGPVASLIPDALGDMLRKIEVSSPIDHQLSKMRAILDTFPVPIPLLAFPQGSEIVKQASW